MTVGDHDTLLRIVDLVLDDLRLRDRMFTARRPDSEQPDLIVIQTGEDGRHYLPAPDLDQPRTLETFITAAQAHLDEVYGQPVPLCPIHHHPLVAEVDSGQIEWACPDGVWSCPVGSYEENTWPPELGAGDLAAALCARLVRRGVTGWRRLGCVERDGRWVAQVGIWPMSPAITEAITKAAVPIPVGIPAVSGRVHPSRRHSSRQGKPDPLMTSSAAFEAILAHLAFR